jgi:hypothetical protein
VSAAYRILAIGYYDGATEGFIANAADGPVVYFRLLAWDSGQDQRLFVVANIAVEDLSRLEELLRAAGQRPEHEIWIPDFRFGGAESASAAKALVERCRQRLKHGWFALGALPDDAETLAPVSPDLTADVAAAIASDAVDDLAPWLAKLS